MPDCPTLQEHALPAGLPHRRAQPRPRHLARKRRARRTVVPLGERPCARGLLRLRRPPRLHQRQRLHQQARHRSHLWLHPLAPRRSRRSDLVHWTERKQVRSSGHHPKVKRLERRALPCIINDGKGPAAVRRREPALAYVPFQPRAARPQQVSKRVLPSRDLVRSITA